MATDCCGKLYGLDVFRTQKVRTYHWHDDLRGAQLFANGRVPLFSSAYLTVVKKFDSFGMNQRAEMFFQFIKPFCVSMLIGNEHQGRINRSCFSKRQLRPPARQLDGVKYEDCEPHRVRRSTFKPVTVVVLLIPQPLRCWRSIMLPIRDVSHVQGM